MGISFLGNGRTLGGAAADAYESAIYRGASEADALRMADFAAAQRDELSHELPAKSVPAAWRATLSRFLRLT